MLVLSIGHSLSRSKMFIFPVETFYFEVLQAPCGEGALFPCLDDPYGFLNLSSHWVPGASHILKGKVLGRIDVLCFWSSMFVIDMFPHPGSTRLFSVRDYSLLCSSLIIPLVFLSADIDCPGSLSNIYMVFTAILLTSCAGGLVDYS